MFKLYHYPGACSLAPAIVLEEVGAAYEIVHVDLAAGEQSQPEFLAINPKGRVPALVTQDGVITENPAILAYIAALHPQAGLAPLNDLFQMARLQSFMGFLASTLQPALSPLARPERFAEHPEVKEALRFKAIKNTSMYLDVIEIDMTEGAWVLGQNYSIADPYLFVFSGLVDRLGLDERRYPKLIAHRAKMLERPAVGKALDA